MQTNPNFFDSTVLMIVIKTKMFISVYAPRLFCCGHGFFIYIDSFQCIQHKCTTHIRSVFVQLFCAIFVRLSSPYRGAHTKVASCSFPQCCYEFCGLVQQSFFVLLNSVPVTRSTTVQFKSHHVSRSVCVFFGRCSSRLLLN